MAEQKKTNEALNVEDALTQSESNHRRCSSSNHHHCRCSDVQEPLCRPP